MSAQSEQPQALEILINSINTFVGRIKDLEAENKQLRENSLSSDKKSEEKLRPYIFVELDNLGTTRTVLLSREAIADCPSKLVLYGNLTTALDIKDGRTKIFDKKTNAVIEYAHMKILARFDHNESSAGSDWYQVGEWGGSIDSGVMAVATGLKAVLL